MSQTLPERRWRFTVPTNGKAAVEARRDARLRLIEAGLSRRRFFHVSASATGLLMTGGVWSRGFAATCEPQPIPHGFDPDGPGIFPFLHLLLPGLVHAADADPSSITDFNGQVGYAVIDGTGRRTDLMTNQVTVNPFEVDLRFMKGTFVAADGRHCHGAFALI